MVVFFSFIKRWNAGRCSFFSFMLFLPHQFHYLLAHRLIHAEIPTGTSYGEDADDCDETEGEYHAVVVVQPVIDDKGERQ